MKDRFLFCAIAAAGWLVSNAAGLAWEKTSAPAPGQESDAERTARHLRVAERRAGTIIIVHRGASAFAPENSLAAYAAAMDYGADGCEVDLRRTRDAVLVLFHDETLEHLTCGFGAVSQLTYRELQALHSQRHLARQRAMLLHLDREIAALLRSPNPAVRGTALVECIDYPASPRRQALRAVVPCALDLPRRK